MHGDRHACCEARGDPAALFYGSQLGGAVNS